MLTRILHNSPELCTFVNQLNLKLSVPQRRHVINVADGLLVTDASKTLAEIQRQFVNCVDPSNIADTFRIAPWTAEHVRQHQGWAGELCVWNWQAFRRCHCRFSIG